MKVRLLKSATKDYSKLKNEKDKITKALIELENFPNVTNIKKLVNYEYSFRKRVGSYRILFSIKDSTIYIARILPRKKLY
jgi:mRNA-degrading endonuclease RelE of RelBE toxin-antitoxin system